MMEIRIKAVPLKELLGNPNWYLWAKCKEELGIKSIQRSFTVTQVKMIIGWFFLYRRHSQPRNRDTCLAAYWTSRDPQVKLLWSMTGKEILQLKDRPCTTTLYRRGLRSGECYDPDQVSKFLK